MKITTKFWIGIVILIVLSPLGLILPAYFKAGPAWGEWRKLSFWNAPISNYAFKGWGEKGLLHLSFAYIISAIVGIAVIFVAAFIIAKILVKKKDD